MLAIDPLQKSLKMWRLKDWVQVSLKINEEAFSSQITERRRGLMVSALGPGSDGPGSSPGRGTALCSWARNFTLIVPLSTQVYK